MNPADGENRTVLITGATQGIGLESALALAPAFGTMAIVGRNAAKLKQAATQIQMVAPETTIQTYTADLSLQSEVRRLAYEFRSQNQRLDVLINNAGGIFTDYRITPEGIEHTWALNHLSYFTLTLELLDLLKSSKPSRILNVASEAHRAGKVDLSFGSDIPRYEGFLTYASTKLANIMFTYALARRLEGSGVTVNCLHPGAIASGFGVGTGGIFRFLLGLSKPFLLTPQKGARTTIYLATAPEVTDVSGKYFSRRRPKTSSSTSRDQALQERLWEASIAKTGATATFQTPRR